MNLKESIQQFLPRYLSESEQKKLLEEIDSFPYNLDSRFYTNSLKNEMYIFQGDGISELQISNFPNSESFLANCLVTSNTCDIDPRNSRLFESRLTYCPILSLEKYTNNLKSKKIDRNKIEEHLKAIKGQKITQILYLPSNGKIPEAIVFLDRLNNSNISVINRGNIKEKRLFTLSN